MGRTNPFDNPFLKLGPDEELWLNQPVHEGAKELAVEALLVSMDLVLPASSKPAPSLSSEPNLADFLRHWYGFAYSGTTFKVTMDTNVQTAIAIHNRWKAGISDPDLRPIADSFLIAARTQYHKLTADGMPDGFRPWRRVSSP